MIELCIMLVAGIILGIVVGWLNPLPKKMVGSSSTLTIKVKVNDKGFKKKMAAIESRIKEIGALWETEQEKLCPHCGYYCTGKTAFCLPPNNEITASRG